MSLKVITYTVDAGDTLKMFDELDFSKGEMKSALRRGLTKSVAILTRETKAQLSTVAYKRPLPNVTFLSKGISVRVWRSATGAVIGLFSKRNDIGFHGAKYKNPAFSLRYIERGTIVRFTKKGGYYRGMMEAKRFFQTAIDLKMTEAATALESNIREAINKVAERRRG